MTVVRTALEKKLIAKRRQGKAISPCRTPEGKAYKVTTKWNVKGDLWAAGHHTGQDFACPQGSLAVAVTWGTVVWVGQYGGWSSKGLYGIHVIVRTRQGAYEYALCHLSSVNVKVGQKVRPGTVVGHTGATGNVTGAHLHFEARPAGGAYGSDISPMRVRKR